MKRCSNASDSGKLFESDSAHTPPQEPLVVIVVVHGTAIAVQDQLRECDLESKVTLDSFGLTPEQREAVLRDFDIEFKAIAGFFH